MITGSVQNVKLWWLFLEHGLNVITFLSNVTVNNKREIAGGEGRGSNGFWSELLVNVVELTDFFKHYLNFTIEFFDFLFREGRLYNFLLFHENFGKNLIHVDSWDFVELSLVDHRDEVIHLLRIPKTPCPNLEFHMLILDALYNVCEEEFHLILHCAELWYFDVGVFVKDVFDLAPFHLLTTFMEQCTLFTVLEPISADEARLTALRVNTNHKTLVAIYTFRRVFEMFGSHLSIYVWYTLQFMD